MKLLGTYLQSEEHRSLGWAIFQEVFVTVNRLEAEEGTESGEKIDYPNIRSLMLRVLATATDQDFIQKFVEKNNTWLVEQFLDVYLANQELSKTKGNKLIRRGGHTGLRKKHQLFLAQIRKAL